MLRKAMLLFDFLDFNSLGFDLFSLDSLSLDSLSFDSSALCGLKFGSLQLAIGRQARLICAKGVMPTNSTPVNLVGATSMTSIGFATAGWSPSR